MNPEDDKLVKRIPPPKYVRVPLDKVTTSTHDIESQEPVGQGFLAVSGDAVNQISFGGIARAVLACLVCCICIIIVFLIVASVQAAQQADTS